jgi:hypothetical protein
VRKAFFQVTATNFWDVQRPLTLYQPKEDDRFRGYQQKRVAAGVAALRIFSGS